MAEKKETSPEELKAKAKSAAAAPRKELVKQLTAAGYPEGDIRPHWSDERLKSELAQAERVASRKAKKKAAMEKAGGE